METGDEIRFQLILHYDGGAFHGWQYQPDVRTVQGELDRAAAHLTGARRPVLGSGRTDAGVHATGQVASVDVPRRWTAAEFHRALNAVLPPDIWVESVRGVSAAFHPRYDALRRTYEYRIGLDAEARSPFHRRWCWALCAPVERATLEAAASTLRGEHSFLAFAKAGQPERGDVCHVYEAHWTDWHLGLRFVITADRFLHHMVRYLVGTMVHAACGRRPASDLVDLLANRTGLETSPPAPPEGLYLTRVEYPEAVRPTEGTTPHNLHQRRTART